MPREELQGDINRPLVLASGLASQAAVRRARVAARQLLAELNYLHGHESEFYYELLVALNQGRSISDLLDRMGQSPAAYRVE